MRKMTCVVYLSTPPVGYSGSIVNEINYNKKVENFDIAKSAEIQSWLRL